MKCRFCGGSMIFDQGHALDPARLKCLSCGREERMPEEQKNEETKKLCPICGKLPYRGHHHGRSKKDKVPIKVDGTERVEKKCLQCGQPRRGRSKFCSKPCSDKHYRAQAKPKKKLLPAVRRQETMPAKTTEMFKFLRRAIILDFMEDIRGQL